MFMIAPSFSWGAQSPDSKNTNTLEAAPAQVIQQREADVDEDEYMIALQKAARQKKESKLEENKPQQPPPDDKAKPQM
jgi:hypothetical protein